MTEWNETGFSQTISHRELLSAEGSRHVVRGTRIEKREREIDKERERGEALAM